MDGYVSQKRETDKIWYQMRLALIDIISFTMDGIPKLSSP